MPFNRLKFLTIFPVLTPHTGGKKVEVKLEMTGNWTASEKMIRLLFKQNITLDPDAEFTGWFFFWPSCTKAASPILSKNVIVILTGCLFTVC